MKKNNHFRLGDLVQELALTQDIGLVVEIELEKPMGYSVQTEEPLFFNQARVRNVRQNFQTCYELANVS